MKASLTHSLTHTTIPTVVFVKPMASETEILVILGPEYWGTYIGCLNADGLMHGKGEIVFASGDLYKGNWTEGKMHGQGKYGYANGDVYNGQWKAGKKDGLFEITSKNGPRKELWRNDTNIGEIPLN